MSGILSRFGPKGPQPSMMESGGPDPAEVPIGARDQFQPGLSRNNALTGLITGFGIDLTAETPLGGAVIGSMRPFTPHYSTPNSTDDPLNPRTAKNLRDQMAAEDAKDAAWYRQKAKQRPPFTRRKSK